MVTIKNKLKQRISIDLEGGKTVGLLAGGTAQIADSALSSPFLKRYIDRGEIVVLPSERGKKVEPKITEKKEEGKQREKPAVKKTKK